MLPTVHVCLLWNIYLLMFPWLHCSLTFLVVVFTFYSVCVCLEKRGTTEWAIYLSRIQLSLYYWSQTIMKCTTGKFQEESCLIVQDRTSDLWHFIVSCLSTFKILYPGRKYC